MRCVGLMSKLDMLDTLQCLRSASRRQFMYSFTSGFASYYFFFIVFNFIFVELVINFFFEISRAYLFELRADLLMVAHVLSIGGLHRLDRLVEALAEPDGVQVLIVSCQLELDRLEQRFRQLHDRLQLLEHHLSVELDRSVLFHPVDEKFELQIVSSKYVSI